MTESIILGIVQGLSEFLPISSSGHLIIVRDILGLEVSYGLAFDAVLQLATTLAVIVYFRKDIWNLGMTFLKWIGVLGQKTRLALEKKDKMLLGAIILGTIPAGILGFFLEDLMDTTFRSTGLVALTLIVGAALMLLAERVSERRKKYALLDASKGWRIGFFQALALIPGMSRSGMTISGGLFLGLNREEATRFSFLLAFPILLGSGLKKLLDLQSEGVLGDLGGELFAGSIAAFVVGILAIHFLIRFLKTHTLKVFVVYRVVLAVVLVMFL